MAVAVAMAVAVGEPAGPDVWCIATSTHLEAIKCKGTFIGAQLLIRLTAWPAPTNSHVSSSDGLELKIPPSCLHSIGLLSSEDAEPLPCAAARVGSGSCELKETLVTIRGDTERGQGRSHKFST